MPNLLPHLQRNLAQAEALGQDDRVKVLKRRIAEEKKANKQVAELQNQPVDAILDQVGDDPELAAAALETENAKEKPRTTLVKGLESVIVAAQEPEED